MIVIDYKEGKQMPTVGWVIRAEDIVERRYPALSVPDLYRFGTMNVLTKALLGILDPLGFKRVNTQAILNDSWVINLRTTKENTMMDAFLRGFGDKEELRKLWEKDNKPMGIDVSEELKDLWKVYNDAFEHLDLREKDAMRVLVSYMKSFIEVDEEKKKIGVKISNLKAKIQPEQPQEDEGDEDE